MNESINVNNHNSSNPILFYYNDVKGRAEFLRLIFICGGISFEDKRISLQEYFQMRNSGQLPFEQMPILQIGETTISQSCAIARYAAKKAGLYPNDDIQAAQTDMIVDAWRDILDIFYGCYVDRVVDNGRLVMKMREAKVRIEKLNEFFDTTLPMHFKTFEKMISSSSNSPFIVGDSLTWADLALFDLLCTFDETANLWNTQSTFFYIPEPYGPYRPSAETLKSLPLLNELSKTIKQISNIKTWLTSNPY